MANPAIKKVTISLDRPRAVILNLNAMVAYEDATGKSMLGGMDMKSMTVKDVRALLWACMAQEDQALTLEQVGAMIDTNNLGEVSEALSRAFGASMPEPAGEAKDDTADPTTTPAG